MTRPNTVHPHPSPRAARRPGVVAVLVAALLAALGSLLQAAPVSAHASLIEMSPESEEMLDVAPTEVRLRFNEAITATPDSIRVFDPAGSELSGIVAESDARSVWAELPPLEDDGSYTVSWKVVSADGHPIRGAYLFHLNEATLTEPVDAGRPADAAGAANTFRAVGAAVALAGLVACLAGALIGRRRGASPSWWRYRWVPVVAGTTAMLGGSVVAVGSSWSASFDVVTSTASGRMAVASVVLAVVGLVASVLPVPARVDPVLAALTALAIALQGHALSLSPVVVSAVATVVHVFAALGWAAGLLWVDHRSRHADDERLRSDVVRFGPWAMGSVVALAATGGLLVLYRVPLEELLSSTYGRLALVKSALLVAAVALAWRNRSAGRSGDPASVRSGVRAELVVLAVALVAGGVLAQVPPPSVDEDGATSDGLFIERQPFGEGEVELTVEPASRGTNEVHIVALSDDGRLMADAEEFTLELELPAEDVGPIEAELQRITDGHSTAYVRIPFQGEWVVSVASRVDQFTELQAEFLVPVGP